MSKTPFDILWAAANMPDAYWWQLWREYETATRGRRMLGWSRGLRDRVGIIAEDPDPEALGGDFLAVVSADQHLALTQAGKWAGAQWSLEQAALNGQASVDEAIACLLGLQAAPVGSSSEDVQLVLSPALEVGF
jgi:hypothetical protein